MANEPDQRSRSPVSSDIKSCIERILRERFSHLPKLDAAQNAVQRVSTGLARLAENQVKVLKDPAAPEQLQTIAQQLSRSLPDLIQKADAASQAIGNLHERFSNKTVTIGVAGKARQGKSTILQAISGLNDTVIPTSDGLPCTGAKSRIVHDTGESFAEIEFYSQADFLADVVHSYFEEIGLPNPPTSFSEFERLVSVPPLPPNAGPNAAARYGKLKALHECREKIRPLLNGCLQRVDISEVRDFVSQEEGRKNYLAVRCANIHVPFPNIDVSDVAIVDLPGLGEVAMGHEEKMVRSLQKDIDAIVLVKRGDPKGDHWDAMDIDVINRIKDAVSELRLSDWLFIVLNELRDGSNQSITRQLELNLPSIGSQVQVLTVDCSHHEAVRDQVFLHVLQHLATNLGCIDVHRLNTVDCQLKSLRADVVAALSQGSKIWGASGLDGADRKFQNEQSRDFNRQLAISLERLCENYHLPKSTQSEADQKSKPEDFTRKLHDFRDHLKQICDDAFASISPPEVSQLADDCDAAHGWYSVLQNQLHYMRSWLTGYFAEHIDNALRGVIEPALLEFCKTLFSDTLLRRILPNDLSDRTWRDQLQLFHDVLDPDRQPLIRSGIDYILQFDYSYQSHVHYRVRRQMAYLDPTAKLDDDGQTPITRILAGHEGAEAAEQMHNGLKSNGQRAVRQVTEALRSLDVDPFDAIFATLEEVLDQLVRRKGVEDEWDDLLHAFRFQIWPEHFAVSGQAKFVVEEAKKVIEAANEIPQLS